MSTRGFDVSTRRRLVACVVLLVLCRVAQGLFAHRPSWFFPAYRTLSKVWAGALALLCSLVPFTIWDMGILALVVLALVVLVRRLRAHEPLLPLLSWVLLGASCTYAAFALGWALNHYAPPLSGELGLEVRTYDTGELADATRAYLERAAQLAPQVPRDDDGALERQGFYELARIAGRSYEGLGERWPLLAGPNVPVKALLVWGYPLLYSGHTGIYWAATGEAGVPLDCAVADQPYIMCHEAAHRLGIASEQEANFCAFLACNASDDVRFAYSGYYNAFVYCFNALWRYDPEAAQQLLSGYAETDLAYGVALVWNDRIATHEHYDAYEGPFEKVGTTVNDGYLKSFGQAEGVRSYGLVVDYLIAWHQAA